jgi:hypothetical protein
LFVVFLSTRRCSRPDNCRQRRPITQPSSHLAARVFLSPYGCRQLHNIVSSPRSTRHSTDSALHVNPTPDDHEQSRGLATAMTMQLIISLVAAVLLAAVVAPAVAQSSVMPSGALPEGACKCSCHVHSCSPLLATRVLLPRSSVFAALCARRSHNQICNPVSTGKVTADCKATQYCNNRRCQSKSPAGGRCCGRCHARGIMFLLNCPLGGAIRVYTNVSHHAVILESVHVYFQCPSVPYA